MAGYKILFIVARYGNLPYVKKKVVVLKLITIQFKFNSNVWLLVAVYVLVCLVKVKLWYFCYFEAEGTI
jgi:hypothetical protein